MTDLINHPGYWLRDDAARSFARMEAARGRPFSVSDAGRTVAQQQALIDRYDAGGALNRPPFLYEPARPAKDGPHVIGGGYAVDINNADDRAWIKANGGRFGWRFNLSWDTVHMIYEPQNDQTTGNAPALPATPTESDDDMTAQDITEIKASLASIAKDVATIKGQEQNLIGTASNQAELLQQINGQYVDVLGRPADLIGGTGYLAEMLAGEPLSAIRAKLIDSDEYRARLAHQK